MSAINRCSNSCCVPCLRGGGLCRVLVYLLLVFCLSTVWICSASAQTCPAPWATAPYVYGTVVLQGSGNGTSGTETQTVIQNSVVTTKMLGLGGCSFMAVPANGFGAMQNVASINDHFVDTSSNTTNDTWSASGLADPVGEQTTFSIDLFSSEYAFGAWGGVPGTFTDYHGPVSEDISWGAANTNGGASLQHLPLLAGAPMVVGTTTYSQPPFDNAQGNPGTIDANWNLSWVFSPVADDECEPCRRRLRRMKGSDISPRSQSLGEDVDLVGTPFYLHYESDRAPGHAGADLFAMLDARNLGGWTLTVHHVFDPMLQGYCAGGGCTGYAIIPKAIFLGNGNTRYDADVQASVSLNGNYYLTSEDGLEVYVFNASGLHLKTLRPLTGAVVYTFAYDSKNRLSSVADANGNVTTIARDGNGNPTSITSPFGQKTTLAVDSNGFLSKITDPAGHATRLTSSAQGLVASLTDPNGRGYTYQYDGLGRLSKHSDPGGGFVSLARTDNASGYSVTDTTALGRASTYLVALSSTASQTSRASTNTGTNGLHSTKLETQVSGQLAESGALPNGSSYSKTMGPDPRWGIQVPVVTSEALTHGNLTMNITNSRAVTLGNPTDPFSLSSETDTENVNGRVYSSVFTGATKTFVDTTPAGRTTTTVLDAQERMSSVQPTGLVLSSFSYDSRGRLASIMEGTRGTTFTYDSNGNLASATNPLSLTLSYTHDAAGNLLTTTLPDGRIIHYSYDANGNLASVTPPGAAAHGYSYSATNLISAYTPPVVAGAGATAFAFNADRDLTKITRPDGQVINYKYDSAGRLSSLVTTGPTISYGYSSTSGNLSKASVSGGEAISYSYNGPLLTRSAWTGTVAGNVSRAYNNNFWVSSQSVNGANTIAYTYDKDGLVSKAGVFTLAHSQPGLYTGGTLGSAKDSIAYNTFAERTSYTAQFGTSILDKVTYTRDQIGRITGLTETIGGTTTSYSYTFDKAGRLTAVKKGTTTVASYTYDQNSNRLSATTSSGTVNGTYDAQDRLLTYGSTSFTYNGNGDLASKTVGAQTTTYQYDVFGNLTAVTLPPGTAIDYIVDAEDHRVGKKVNGVVVDGFLYDGGNLVAQLDANNQIVSQFVYGSGGVSPDYMVAGGVTYRIFSDHLGSVRLVVNSASGQIVQRMDYDEFGNVISDSNPGFQPFGYAGGLYDQDTKLVRFGMRDYDAVTGRWTAKDPIRFDGGDTNLYGYVLNDPVNLIDPSGLDATCPCKDSDRPTKAPDLTTMTVDSASRTAQKSEIVKPTVPAPAPATPRPANTPAPGDGGPGLSKNIRGFDVGMSISKSVNAGEGAKATFSHGVGVINDPYHQITLPNGKKMDRPLPIFTWSCEY